jgi:hypothetical protein
MSSFETSFLHPWKPTTDEKRVKEIRFQVEALVKGAGKKEEFFEWVTLAQGIVINGGL